MCFKPRHIIIATTADRTQGDGEILAIFNKSESPEDVVRVDRLDSIIVP